MFGWHPGFLPDIAIPSLKYSQVALVLLWKILQKSPPHTQNKITPSFHHIIIYKAFLDELPLSSFTLIWNVWINVTRSSLSIMWSLPSYNVSLSSTALKRSTLWRENSLQPSSLCLIFVGHRGVSFRDEVQKFILFCCDLRLTLQSARWAGLAGWLGCCRKGVREGCRNTPWDPLIRLSTQKVPGPKEQHTS